MNIFCAGRSVIKQLLFGFAVFVFIATFSQMPAKAQMLERKLNKFSLSAPNNPATLGTSAPGEEVSLQLSVSAEVPPGEVTWPHGGFKFEWTLAPADIQKLVPGTVDDWAAAPITTGVTLTPPILAMDKPYLYPDQNKTGTQQAILKANFPTVGTYRIRVKAVGRYNVGTGVDYVSDPLTIDIRMTIAEPSSVTILQSEATPNPGTVNKIVSINLNAALEGIPEAELLGVDWAWQFVSIEYRPTVDAPWTDDTPDFELVLVSAMGANPEYYSTFRATGSWRVKMRATANYTRTSGRTGSSSAEAYIGN